MADEKKEPLGPQLDPSAEPFQPFGKKSASAEKPQVAPDGHVNLSQEDIDARDA
jgi:hypothetical protein